MAIPTRPLFEAPPLAPPSLPGPGASPGAVGAAPVAPGTITSFYGKALPTSQAQLRAENLQRKLGMQRGTWRESADYADYQKSRLQASADEQDWPDWIRKQYGLAVTGKDAALRGLEDMVTAYRSGTSQDLSQQALDWAKQQPYLQLWARGKTANTPDRFPVLQAASQQFAATATGGTNSAIARDMGGTGSSGDYPVLSSLAGHDGGGSGTAASAALPSAGGGHTTSGGTAASAPSAAWSFWSNYKGGSW